MNQNRVLIVAPVPPPIGGMTLQGQALCNHLTAEGIDARLIPTNPTVMKLIARVKGVRTIAQTALYFLRLITTVPRGSVLHILAASYFYFFARVVPAVVLGRLCGLRVILNYRGGEAPRFFLGYSRWIVPVLRLCDVITVPSEFLRRVFSDYGFPAEIVPNLLELERFGCRPRDQARPRLVVSRNLEPMYNVMMALQAYEIIKERHADARLDILGTGSEEAELKSWVRQRSLRDVRFHGAVDHRRMPEYLDNCDILLNPTNVDNMPMTLLEAFAAGLPVVSTDVGGIPDMLGESAAALLVKPGDYREMAKKVELLVADGDLVRRMTESGRRLAQGFDWPAVREKLLAVYYPNKKLASWVENPGAE